MQLDAYEIESSKKWMTNVQLISQVMRANPEILPAPNTITSYGATWNAYAWHDYDAKPDDNGEYPLIASAQDVLLSIRKCFSGVIWEKIATDYNYGYRGEWRGVQLTITSSRDAVCERVEIGTEEYEEPITETIGTVKKTRPVYEWRCPE